MDASSPPEKPAVAGLTNPEGQPVSRVPVRTREGRVTTSAWHLEVTAAEGRGGIVRVDAPGGALFRGDGVFLGWEQARLAEAYARLVPEGEVDTFQTQQLG
jgi:hypothetical protein